MEFSSYRERDFAFGQIMLSLRTALGMTQIELAEYLGVSRRSVGDWENGASYPKVNNLKQLIELGVKQQAFAAGHEAEEVRVLWQAAHQKVLLDEIWLARLIREVRTSTPDEEEEVISTTPALAPVLVLPSVAGPKLDWGEAPSLPSFYGREAELQELNQWIVEERCRVVSLLGMGGMGKTTLAVNLMRAVAPHFEVVLWRSVRDAPVCETLLASCLRILAPQTTSETLSGLERRFRLLLEQLQSQRVLLVLDNLETLMEEGQEAGHFRSGYEDYGRLLQMVAETNHQSCLILTSRENPVSLISSSGSRSPVRILRLNRLDATACEQLLLDKDVAGTPGEQEQLSEIFGGNPLALKIVGQTIADLFGGEIAPFLAQSATIFGEVKDLLDQQFARLTPLEQELLLWLGVIREPATLDDLLTSLVKPISHKELLEAVEGMHRRSLVERGERAGTFVLQSVVLEYLTARLVEEVADELKQAQLPLVRLTRHALEQAQARDYVRQSQLRLLINPLLARLKGSPENPNLAESYLKQALERVRELPPAQQGYAGGNILNLLIALEVDLTCWNFSGLKIWQAYLAGVELHQVNLSGSDLSRSVFTEGFNSILALAYSPDGQFLAGGTLAGDIKIWQAQRPGESSGYTLHLECRGHTDLVSAVAYSPDGQFLASGSYDHTVRLWDAESGENLLVLQGHTAGVRAVAFSPDGRFLASGSLSGNIRLWRVATGELVAVFKSQSSWVWAVAFSPDGRFLASGNFDGTVQLWAVTNLAANDPKPSATLGGHQGAVLGVSFSPDGQTLFSSGADGTIRVWNLDSREQIQLLKAHTGPVQALVVSPDGLRFASGGSDRTIRLWQIGSEKTYLTLTGHNAPVVALAFSPEGTILASSSADRSVRFWSVQSGEALTTLQGYSSIITSTAFSPQGNYLVSTGSNCRVLLWQLNGPKLPLAEGITPAVVLKGHTHQPEAVAFSPNGKRLASAGQDATIRVWDLARVGKDLLNKPRLILTGHTDVIIGITFHPAGNLLASASTDGTVRLWSAINGELMATLEGHQDIVRTVVFSPDGRVLASGGNDGTVRLWDTTNSQLITSLNNDKSPIADLDYAPLAPVLACARYDGTIQVWQTGDYSQPPLILKGHAGVAYSVAFNPASTTTPDLISGGIDGTLRLWDTRRSKEVARFQHGGHVRSVAFTPDGAKALSAGEGGLIKLWEIASGELVATYRDFQPYEGVNLNGVSGLTAAQRAALLALGAVEN